jgi:hypothetical protein
MGRPGGRINDALFFAGVVALIFALCLFLYAADPSLHHDVNRLWHVINGVPRPDSD